MAHVEDVRYRKSLQTLVQVYIHKKKKRKKKKKRSSTQLSLEKIQVDIQFLNVNREI